MRRARAAGAGRVHAWWDGLLRTIRQNPLIETAPSLEGVRECRSERPNAIFVGLGLCSQERLTAAVPIDILGMLLPAESVRQAVGAERIVALIADRHAMVRFPKAAVNRRAEWFEAVLGRARRRLPLGRMEIRRASDFHDEQDYVDRHEAITERAEGSVSEYLTRQVADVDYLEERVGPILKVGWCLSKRAADVANLYDERGFDAWVEPCTGRRLPFVYTKPGRVLDDRRKKAVPYVVHEPSKRICVRADEAPLDKVERVGELVSKDTYKGVRKHLVTIAKAYAELEPDAERDAAARLETLVEVLAA